MANNGNFPKTAVKSKPVDMENNEIKEAQKLKNQNELILYHGNKDRSMVPSFDFENNNNDYGKGFYTTPDKELGKEWAYSKYTEGEQGYLFTYKCDMHGLNILDLTEYDSLHWVAELMEHRKININGREALQDTIDEVKAKYKLDTSGYDVIIGYRADDSYFTYATDFLSGTIYRETLEKALRSGNLGLQVFIKSAEAFDRLHRVSEPEPVAPKYRELFLRRDENARAEYKSNKQYDRESGKKQKENYKCYDEWWLGKDMENMGYIFEYCQKYCNELFNTNIDKIKFLNAFMISKCRAEMEIGDPKLLSQAACDTIKNFVEYEYNGETGQFDIDNNTDNAYLINRLYWVGWIYAYIHYKSKFPSSKIVEIMPIENMLEEYYTAHEMDNDVYYSKIKHLFTE